MIDLHCRPCPRLLLRQILEPFLCISRLDPTSMESKKAAQSAHIAEAPNDSALQRTHQHINNNALQHQQQLRLLQYGLKLPHLQHPPLSQSHHHQQLNSPNVYPHVHQHAQQATYQQPAQAHRYPVQAKFNNQAHQHVQPNAQQYLRPKIDQPIYQSNDTLPSQNIYNPLNQQTAQIWVPQQPPLHYHQPQQLKLDNQQKQSPGSPGPVQNKPKVAEKKRIVGGGSQQLRSPVAKRPNEAPVAMQGWLYKQGSEGFMLWKKRWFVLSEYCLFYYKGKLHLATPVTCITLDNTSIC